MVRGIKTLVASKAMARAVDIDGINSAFLRGLEEGLSGGQPFALGLADGSPLLEVEILDLGLDLPEAGALGVFVYDVRVTLRDLHGNRLYRDRQTCELPVGDPESIQEALDAANAVRRSEAAPAQALQDAFEQVAETCAAQVAQDLRRRSGQASDEGIAKGDGIEIPDVDMDIPEVDMGLPTVQPPDSGT